MTNTRIESRWHGPAAAAAILLLAFAGHTVAEITDSAAQAGAEAPAERSAGPPAMVRFESSVGRVDFPHASHLRFGCVACHHQIHAGELETPHPQYLESTWVNCEICHDASPAGAGAYYKCSHCHHAIPANIADETLSAKVVTHKSCWKCHASGTGLDASSGCGDCHVREG